MSGRWKAWARHALDGLTPEMEASEHTGLRESLEWTERTGIEPYYTVEGAVARLGLWQGMEGDE